MHEHKWIYLEADRSTLEATRECKKCGYKETIKVDESQIGKFIKATMGSFFGSM